MTDKPEAASDYFLEIEAHFALRRGTPFILSAKDWALMKEWHDGGVPLPVVIEALDAVFEKNETSGRRKSISSLSYCKHAVKDLWSERREMYVGGSEQSPEVNPAELLALLASALESSSAPAAAVAPIAETIRGLASERSVPRIEERLIEVERELIDAILAALPPPAVTEIRTAVSRALGDTSRLDESTRARTEEANLRRIVRDRFGVPRLTLF